MKLSIDGWGSFITQSSIKCTSQWNVLKFYLGHILEQVKRQKFVSNFAPLYEANVHSVLAIPPLILCWYSPIHNSLQHYTLIITEFFHFQQTSQFVPSSQHSPPILSSHLTTTSDKNFYNTSIMSYPPTNTWNGNPATFSTPTSPLMIVLYIFYCH